MTQKEVHDKCLANATPLTQEMIDSSKQKEYASGREKMVGDIVLWGILCNEFLRGAVDKGIEITLELTTYHIDEIGTVYEFDESDPELLTSDFLPRLVKI